MAKPVRFDLDALDRMAQAQKRFPALLTRDMTAAAQRVILPAFQQEMRRRPAPGQIKRMVIPGSYATAGFAGFSTMAGVSREVLSGGGRASQLARAFEFGSANREKKTRIRDRRVRFGWYMRRASRQLPTRRRGGWIYYPAMGALDKRAIPLYVQLAVRLMANALEGKS